MRADPAGLLRVSCSPILSYAIARNATGCLLDKGYNNSHTIGMKTAISIPDALFEAAERVAQKLCISRSEFYQRAIKKYLEDHSHTVIRETLDKLYGDDPDIGRLDPGIEYLQDAALREEEW